MFVAQACLGCQLSDLLGQFCEYCSARFLGLSTAADNDPLWVEKVICTTDRTALCTQFDLPLPYGIACNEFGSIELVLCLAACCHITAFAFLGHLHSKGISGLILNHHVGICVYRQLANCARIVGINSVLDSFDFLMTVTCQMVIDRFVLECICYKIAFLSGWSRGGCVGHADGVMVVEHIVESQLPIIDIGMWPIICNTLLHIVSTGLLLKGVLEIGILAAFVLHLHPKVFNVSRSKEVEATRAIVNVYLFLTEDIMIDTYQCLIVETESLSNWTNRLDADNRTHRSIIFGTRCHDDFHILNLVAFQ